MVRRKRAASFLKKISQPTPNTLISKKGHNELKDSPAKRGISDHSSEAVLKKRRSTRDNAATLQELEDSFLGQKRRLVEHADYSEILEEETSEAEDHATSAVLSKVKKDVPGRTRRSVGHAVHVNTSVRKSSVHGEKTVKRNVHVLQDIKKLQRSTDLLIPRVAFGRVCREIFQQYGRPDLRVAVAALACLQESAEAYLVQFFEDSYLCTMHANRKTLMNKDLRLARRIGGRSGYYV